MIYSIHIAFGKFLVHIITWYDCTIIKVVKCFYEMRKVHGYLSLNKFSTGL